MNIKKSKELFDTWAEPLQEFLESKEFTKIAANLKKEYAYYSVIPEDTKLLFKVFRETPYNSLKVIILGQDPYSNPENAYDGLAFSNSNLFSPQPSLRTILKEVENDVYDGFDLNTLADLDLTKWSKQGILLLNTALSVRHKEPESHLHIWNKFTNFVINKLQDKNDLVWMLWGRKSQKYKNYITNKSHAILEAGHPSPLNTANPFLGCKCFSKANEELKTRNLKEIIW